ncbi:hypothetical protein [Ruminiclostridium hungatei]|uniref:hypothetical protein n=1 Tax=Ruminiclostridium hungatei TaxID=48256 RepID=UPI0013FD6228|nr:hypothetical protein [Ruminiclostridium hungatei]
MSIKVKGSRLYPYLSGREMQSQFILIPFLWIFMVEQVGFTLTAPSVTMYKWQM